MTLAISACSADVERPRNVLLISVDTLRADRLGCYGYSRPTSPAMDQFAAEGTVFEDAMASSPWTLPSHVSMLSGLDAHRHGAIDRRRPMPPDVPHLAEILSNAGFETAALVNSRYLGRKLGLARGFGHFRRFPEIPKRGPQITRAALRWLKDRGPEPFFLFLHYYDVHSSYEPKAEYRELMVGEYQGPATGATRQLLAFRHGHVTLDETDVEHVSDLYDAEIRELDDELGRLRRGLQELGLEDTTLLVLTSDHGEEFLEHGGVLHGRTMYQELLHVPWILRGPGVEAGRRVTETVTHADVVPTILGLLDLSPPAAFDGIDVLTSLERDDPVLRRRFVVASADHNNAAPDVKRAIRFGTHKLFFDRSTQSRALYDLAEDPGERNDLYPQRSQLGERLFEALQRDLAAPRSVGASVSWSEEERKSLEALGYLGDAN